MRLTTIFAFGLAFLPQIAAAQTVPEQPRTTQHFQIQAAAGSTLEGGNTQSAAFGYSLNRHLTLLIGADRTHLPTRIEQHDRTFAATRGGTFTVLTAGLRVDFVADRRAVPYGLVGLGRGFSRPNVNDVFPDRVTNGLTTAFSGAGVRVALARNVDLFAEALGTLSTERDSVALSVPVRGGVMWRF